MKKTKVTQFTAKTIDLLREQIEAALAVVGDKYNVRFDLGRITYSSANNTAKGTLNFAAKASDGSVIDQTRENWKQYVKHYSYVLKPEWLDQTFCDGYEQYKIIGLYPNRRRLPVRLLRLRDNSERIATTEFVRDGMNRKEAARKIVEARYASPIASPIPDLPQGKTSASQGEVKPAA